MTSGLLLRLFEGPSAARAREPFALGRPRLVDVGFGRGGKASAEIRHDLRHSTVAGVHVADDPTAHTIFAACAGRSLWVIAILRVRTADDGASAVAEVP